MIKILFFFLLTLGSFADMLDFEWKMTRPLPCRSRAGPSRPLVPHSARVPATSPAPQQVQVSAAGPSRRLEKMRCLEEADLANPPAVNLRSVMTVARGAAREAMA